VGDSSHDREIDSVSRRLILPHGTGVNFELEVHLQWYNY
jgi:hypothetical protein